MGISIASKTWITLQKAQLPHHDEGNKKQNCVALSTWFVHLQVNIFQPNMYNAFTKRRIWKQKMQFFALHMKKNDKTPKLCTRKIFHQKTKCFEYFPRILIEFDSFGSVALRFKIQKHAVVWINAICCCWFFWFDLQLHIHCLFAFGLQLLSIDRKNSYRKNESTNKIKQTVFRKYYNHIEDCNNETNCTSAHSIQKSETKCKKFFYGNEIEWYTKKTIQFAP